MKLISLNVEGKKHESLIFPFFANQNADVICLMEAPEAWCDILQESGYHTTFAPMLLRDRNDEPIYTEGLIFASKEPHTSTTEYYYGSKTQISVHTHRAALTVSNPVIIATTTHNGVPYTFATTHIMVTMDGRTDEHQSAGVEKLHTILRQQQPHILCGDFNMPRGVNELYESFTSYYVDRIPKKYTSSLDRSIHRMANHPDLNAPIFDTFMVDYVFTQSPYTASDVRLEFNLSDHAAIIATVEKMAE